MALETASFLNQLSAVNPADTDTINQGAAHIRLIKSALLATFPNLNAVVTTTPAELNMLTGWVTGGGISLPAPNDSTSLANGVGASVLLNGQTGYTAYRLGANQNNFTIGYRATPATSYTTALTYTGATAVMNLTGTAPDYQVNGNSVQVPVGSVVMFSGSVANLPANWKLCDGTNGTPDLRNQFIIGAGGTYAVGSVGGSATLTLTQANLPPHSHGVNDNGHTHGANVHDPGHGHGISDPGHGHTATSVQLIRSGGASNWWDALVDGPNASSSGAGTNPGHQSAAGIGRSGTGIWVQGSQTGVGVSIAGNYAGITIQNTGNGTPAANLPPYYALAFIMRVA